MTSPEIEESFPRLAATDYRVTSPGDPYYNCIAWAAGESTRCWWPRYGYYWPPDVPREPALNAFVEAFATLGYRASASPDPVAGLEKVAIFVDTGGQPTHAARQVLTGRWTSKLGNEEDIEHVSVADVGGAVYGEVAVVLERGTPGAP